MNMLLQDLLTEGNEVGGYRRNPPLKRHPEIRKVGAEIVKHFLRNVGKDKLVKWEVEDRDGQGIIRLYLPVLHHNPHYRRGEMPLIQIVKTSERFGLSFRMFGNGNLICIEMEVKV